MASQSQPTCTRLRIRTVDDANQLFHAVQQDRAPLFSRRLTVAERRNIHTGCVFVWEERCPAHGASGEGIERWTDGRRWSCSRVKNDFLFYQEKLPEIGDAAFTAAMNQNRLVKQTYSVYVQTSQGRRKWHLVAYYTPDTADTLLSVDDIPYLADLRASVPRGAYKPARITRGRPRPENAHYDKTGEEPGDFPALRPYPENSPRLAPSPQPSSADSDTSSEHRSDVSAYETRPDPIWVLQNGTRINLFEAAERAVEYQPSGPNSLAPLVYRRPEPYHARHPLDNDALRMFDATPWMTAHW